MTQNLYYVPPSIEAFEDMKKVCIEVWKEKNDEYGYSTEKIGQIEHIQNVQDNFMYMFAMFDIPNQKRVVSKLSEQTKNELRDRMLAGGNEVIHLEVIGLLK